MTMHSISPVVITIHGIRTRGEWQKSLAARLATAGFIPHALDFGEFGAIDLLSPIARKRKIQWLHGELDSLRQKYQCDRFSVIAHSFGTFLCGEVIKKYPDHLFDKLILVGSILDPNYDWKAVLDRWQVRYVLHEFGSLDRWPLVAAKFVGGAGDAGSRGFTSKHERLADTKFDRYEHSSYFSVVHLDRYWLPVLRRCVVDPQFVSRVHGILSLAIQTVAKHLGIQSEDLRANIFAEQRVGELSIPHNLHLNMTDSAERGVEIEVGRGASGHAYGLGRQAIAILNQGWGRYTLPNSQLALIDPELKWIISTPIPDPTSRWGFCGVLNIDSLRYAANENLLRGLLPHLLPHAKALGNLFRGMSRYTKPHGDFGNAN
jgi:pimeloyl-ACP methyl ester carboxylesterase